MMDENVHKNKDSTSFSTKQAGKLKELEGDFNIGNEKMNPIFSAGVYYGVL